MATTTTTATTTSNTTNAVYATKQPAGYVPALAFTLGKAPKKPFRGARGAWYTAMVAYAKKHGVTPQGYKHGTLVLFSSYEAAMLANPPSTPKTGKLAGKCEPVNGWVGWFTRNGLVKPVGNVWVPAS